MTAADRFQRAVDAARSAFATRDWGDAITWHEAAEHAWETDVAPAIEAGELAGLLAQRLRDDRDASATIGARAQLATAGADPDALATVATRVRDLLRAAPARVELWRLLVKALARAGRVQEALDALDEASAARGTIGLDPSPALEDLRSFLVAGDPLPREEEDLPFLVLTPPGEDQQVVAVPLDRPIELGRSPDTDVPVSWDGEVSRRHLQFRPDGNRHLLTDLGSSNGTVLNGRRLADPLHLVDGDVVRVGTTTIVYRNPAGAPAAQAPLASGTMLRVMPTPSSVVNPDRSSAPDELDVTILFCDLRGWTTASGQITPQRARELLDAFYDLGADMVVRHGGTVLQMAGDEVYACFGAPVPQPDHADRGLAAALDLAARERALAAELQARGLPVVRFGIGLNSGPVAPFAIGAADRRQLGLVGTTVNVAARLCSQAGPGEVVFAQSLRDRGAGTDLGESIGPLELKNVAEPVRAFRAVRHDGDS